MTHDAHSRTPGDTRDWQPLAEHLMAVAALAKKMARPFGLERAAFLAGLRRDLGKYSADFQKRIKGADIRADHSTAGAAALLGDLAAGADRSLPS